MQLVLISPHFLPPKTLPSFLDFPSYLLLSCGYGITVHWREKESYFTNDSANPELRNMKAVAEDAIQQIGLQN